MELRTTMRCLQALQNLGISDQHLISWYEAVFVNPDLSRTDLLFQKVAQHIVIDDLLELSRIYVTQGFITGIRSTVDYFRQIVGVKQSVDVTVSSTPHSRRQFGGVFLYRAVIENNILTESKLLIDKDLWRHQPASTYVEIVAHEMWHAYQTMCGLNWIRSVGFLGISPSSAPLGVLYAVNMLCSIEPDDDLSGYGEQLSEREAYRFNAFIMDWIETLFQEAYLSGRITGERNVFYSLPICH